MSVHGTKFTCAEVSCQTKFYDMNKESPVCPKCGLVVVIPKARKRGAGDEALKAKRKKWQ